MNKIYFGMLFLIIATVIILILNHYDLIADFGEFALIPILAAYFIGQYSERKYGHKNHSEHQF